MSSDTSNAIETNPNSSHDWISQLAAQVARSGSSAPKPVAKSKRKNGRHKKHGEIADEVSSGTPNNGSNGIIPSKDERIRKRNEKKRRRLERINNRMPNVPASTIQRLNSVPNRSKKMSNSGLQQLKMNTKILEQKRKQNQNNLHKVSRVMSDAVQTIHPEQLDHEQYFQLRPFVDPQKGKGKATVGGAKLTNIQPSKSSYGGLGLARPSLLLTLRDDSFIPKLEQEFTEHIPGFFGKQRTKTMKKQLDGKMLWRTLQKSKEINNGVEGNQSAFIPKELAKSINGKKLFKMTPDEKVEYMIKAGII